MILFVILFCLGVASFWLAISTDTGSRAILTVLTIILMFYSGLSLEYALNSRFPSALDVYRGKTTLSIKTEIVDSKIINKDSTVVWKNN